MLPRVTSGAITHNLTERGKATDDGSCLCVTLPFPNCRATMNLPKTAALASLLATATPFAPPSPGGRPAARLGAVSRKDSYDITLLPGDGIGPEIMESAKSVLSALCDRCGFELNLREALIGGAAIDAVNDPFPDATLEACQSADSVLLSCIGGYKWDTNPRELRPETGLLKMRKSMGLFANLRPAKVLDQLVDASTLKREVVEGVDVMVVRELTGDVYFGEPKGIDTDADGESVVALVAEALGGCFAVVDAFW